MRHPSYAGLLLLLAALALPRILMAQDAAPGAAPPTRWYKGNTHTHTIKTDGDSSPVDVVRFYREQGYNFVVLSDHDSITPTDGLNALFGTAESNATDRTALPFRPFMVIQGEEVTDAFIPGWSAPTGSPKPPSWSRWSVATSMRPPVWNSPSTWSRTAR